MTINKTILGIFLAVAIPLIGRAQNGFVSEHTTNSIQVFDAAGKLFANPGADIEGSPFFEDEWAIGSVILAQGGQFDSIRLRLDIQSEEVHYLDRSEKERVLPKGLVREMIWFGSAGGKKDSTHFVCGFPPVEEQDAGCFYKVLTTGPLWLLFCPRKFISEQKKEMSGEVSRQYSAYNNYYLFDGRTMQRVKKDKAVIGGKEMKFKNIGELKKAVDVYNAS
jgi:hypothetical protein